MRQLLQANDATKARLRRAGLIVWALVMALALSRLGAAIGNRYQLALNETDSLPNWAFIVDRSRTVPDRGDYFVFVAPTNPYYPAGFRFTKRVVGIPGDVVSVQARSFYINGRWVGDAKTADKEGRPAAIAGGGTIPPGHYFMVTPSPDSLDSRYRVIGLVNQARLIGRAVPVM